MDDIVQSKKSDHNLLSQSYTKGVERIIGLQTCTYGLSSEILQNRQAFWNKLFLKYTGQISDETGTDDVNTGVPIKKSLMSIQYWVNTGYLPTDANVLLSVDSKSCTSVENKCSDFLHDRLTREVSTDGPGSLQFYENSTTSSVDTAAYILSNNNITSKIEATAIVEGAKHDTPVNSRNVIERNSFGIVDTRNTSFRNPEHCYDKSPSKISIETNYDCRKKSCCVTQNSSNADSMNANKSILKKLYNRTDSPIDLVYAKSNNSCMSKSKKYMHPALNTECRRKKRHTICIRGNRKKHSRMFNTSFKRNKEKKRIRSRSYFNDINDVPSKCNGSLNRANSSGRNNLRRDENLIEYKDKSLKTLNSNECKKNHEAIEKGHLNPVVCLRRLSESDLQKEKNRNMGVKDVGNLYPIVCLRRLSDNDIKITCSDSAKTMSTNSWSLADVEMETSDTNSMQHSSFLFRKPENILFIEDTDSSLSTLFIYKCESGTFHNDFSARKSLMSGNNHDRLAATAKETLNKTDEKLNGKFLGENFRSNIRSRSRIMGNNIGHLYGNTREKQKDKDIRKIKKSKIVHNIEISSDSFSKENYERDGIRTLNTSVNSSNTSPSDKSKEICKNIFNNNLHVNNDEQYLSLGEDDGFVKLVHKYYSTWK